MNHFDQFDSNPTSQDSPLTEPIEGGSAGWNATPPPLQMPPIPKKKSRLKWILLIIGVILIIPVTMVVVGIVTFNNVITEKSNPINSALEEAIEEDAKESQPAVGSEGEGTASKSDTAKNETPSDGKALTTMEIADKVMPSVVGVVVYQKDEQGELIEAGEGSGIIISEEGYIATNAHVVFGDNTILSAQGRPASADKIEVYFEGGDYVTATLVGADSRTDLALLKVKKEGLVPAVIGDSQALRIGEKAVAIGNPTGRMLSGSLTQGVISGLDRTISMGQANSYTMNYIQTDAAISPGNSGGALANTYGEVIGINTSKISADAYEGIGFAIPIHDAMPILDNLKENGYVAGRPRIGITFTPITAEMAELFDIPLGMRVVEVDPTVDAHAQGLLPGSIITHIDGEEVGLLEDVASVLEDKKPGDTVKLTLMQRGKNNKIKEQTMRVALAEDLTSKIVE